MRSKYWLAKLVPTETQLSKTYSEMFETEATQAKREKRLRASGLPTCSLKILRDFLLDDDSEVESEEAYMDYFCSVGTSVHTYAQKWMARSGKTLGHWECKCGNKVEFSTEHICKVCGAEMLYEEVTVNLDILSGHVDGILKVKIKKGGDGQYLIVFDYKTTKLDNIRKETPWLPVPKHLIQVAAYALILEKQHNLTGIKRLSVLYIARDNPKYFKEYSIEWTDELRKETMELMRQQIRGWKAAMKSLSDKNVKAALRYKQCKSFVEYRETMMPLLSPNGCILSSICFDEKAVTEYFNQLWD